MATLIGFHEVEDGQLLARDWNKGPGSRHEMFAQIGITARNFRDPKNPNSTGVILEVPDMEKFQSLMESDEGKKAMSEERLKIDTMRILAEFTP